METNRTWSSTARADHYDLRSSDAIMAFVSECKKRKNVQLCIYSTKQTKRKQIICGSSVVDNIEEESPPKKIRVYIFNLFNLYNLFVYKTFFYSLLEIRI